VLIVAFLHGALTSRRGDKATISCSQRAATSNETRSVTISFSATVISPIRSPMFTRAMRQRSAVGDGPACAADARAPDPTAPDGGRMATAALEGQRTTGAAHADDCVRTDNIRSTRDGRGRPARARGTGTAPCGCGTGRRSAWPSGSRGARS
jgi:hypothetical protein